MKPYFLLGAILALALPLFGQSPQKFKFQAVARDASGQPYTSVNLGVRISLVRDGVSGLIDYAERHVVTTSPLGVFDLEIGGGLPVSGTFADADWANHPYYLKVDIDPDGGTSYMNLGTSQLLSVPYAIYAGTAGNGGGGNPTDELQNLIYNPVTQTLTLTNGNTVTLNFPAGTDAQHLSLNGTNLSIENGNTIDLSPLMDGVEDADADPMNELQDISFNPATNQLSISSGSTVTLPAGGTDADADPTNEIQIISKTGSTVTLSNGGGSFTDEVNDADSDPTNEIETWATLSGIPPDIADGDDVDDADADPMNELQNLSLSGSTLSLSSGGGNVDLSGLGSVWSQNGNQIYYNTGRVGLGNTNPDEELVVGTNLNSGWAVPAITVGSNSGGGIQVGNPTIKLSIGSGNAFNRGRIIQSDANGYGQGIIEMRTRQLNIGTEPGINTNRTYPVRIVQNTSATGGAYGMQLINGTNNDSNWELYVGGSGNLLLYADNAPRGQFDAVSGNYTATSDARLKTGIQDLPAILPKVQQLAPKTYQYRGQEGRSYIGLLAQELQLIFPDLVSETPARNAEETPTLLVDYNQLSVIALKALQEQQALIDRQQDQIQNLEVRLARLEKQVLKD
ncbi:MAG: tail fiber domain-containing protein [bacterium]|nr:tail fiber domain-containing protein [bacterium]